MPPRYSKELVSDIVYGYQKSQSKTSPCEATCPAGNRIQAMETLLKEGKFGEAHAKLLTRNPFPGVTGRICPHPCEDVCNRCHYDEAVSIRALERAAADAPISGTFSALPDTGKKVAVIGSGPAGMSCAYFLRLLGHDVTVFESAALLGGAPRTSVPDFRLPKCVIDREVGFILSLGVKACTNVRIGRDIEFAELIDKYDTCVLAVGNGTERRLDIPGIENAVLAVSFLTESNLLRSDLKGRKVAILGGGGVAFDCAFTAKRLHAAEVSLIFPEASDAIKAPAEEVEQAAAEGITLYPSRLSRQIGAKGVSAARLKSFSFSEKGELVADTAEDDILDIDADLVICASGLLPDLSFLPEGIEKTSRGHLVVSSVMQTSMDRVFAAGDIVTGPATVASAIGSGRMAALGVHACLTGAESLPAVFFESADSVTTVRCEGPANADIPHVVEFKEIENPSYHEHAPRQKNGRNADGVLFPFAEIDLGLTQEQVLQEASRCMHCGHCINCGTCVERCPNYILDKDDDGPFVKYPLECWHCACCRIACPTGSIRIEFPITMLI